MTNAQESTATSEQRKRHRSPGYPTVSLRDAVERVRLFYKEDGKAGAAPELAAKHIGYSTAHGGAFSTLAALKKFGLVEDRAGRIVTTPRAIEILNLREDDPRSKKALIDAALSPSIYQELIGQFGKHGLPADDTLEAELVAYKNFNPKVVRAFVRDFKDTLEFAGISDLSVLSSDNITSEIEENREPERIMENVVRTNEGTKIKVGPILHPEANTFSMPVGKDTTAQVVFTGAKVRPQHFDNLIKYLELAKSAIEEQDVEREDA